MRAPPRCGRPWRSWSCGGPVGAVAPSTLARADRSVEGRSTDGSRRSSDEGATNLRGGSRRFTVLASVRQPRVSREAQHGRVSTPDEKTCRSCGRRIEWRKKWAANWDEVAYCSDACRRRKVTALDRQLEERIRELLAARAATSTICPSDVARSIAPDDEAAWRDLMEPVRRAARRLVAAGEVDITQGGSVVDPSTAKGPIRIRRRRAGGGR
ncbi:DUF2256 and DUF3253 domain-containing protein [Frigoribacterium sp. CFBP 13729]|nr:DUF2256 and DUF3253 domain-containing protein [Frigoribacterium sp. CFBP 13729]MBD8610220.1 DUF2256 and DUF3253 domain-containing protein [Frigoribacterium sp. CFBP 13729]